jgi:hypothetical protein
MDEFGFSTLTETICLPTEYRRHPTMSCFGGRTGSRMDFEIEGTGDVYQRSFMCRKVMRMRAHEQLFIESTSKPFHVDVTFAVIQLALL